MCPEGKQLPGQQRNNRGERKAGKSHQRNGGRRRAVARGSEVRKSDWQVIISVPRPKRKIIRAIGGMAIELAARGQQECNQKKGTTGHEREGRS